MEQLPSPEEEPEILIWTCENCDHVYPVNDKTVSLYIDMVEDGKYSFIQLECEEESCMKITNYFVDYYNTELIGERTTNIYLMNDIPDWIKKGRQELIDKNILSKTIEEQWSDFWNVYNPEPWEFS